MLSNILLSELLYPLFVVLLNAYEKTCSKVFLGKSFCLFVLFCFGLDLFNYSREHTSERDKERKKKSEADSVLCEESDEALNASLNPVTLRL